MTLIRRLMGVLVVVSLMFAGFASAAAQANKPVTLRMVWWGGDARHKATLAAIELYQKTHPGVTIQGEYGGFDGYDQKIKLQLAARTAPDILQLDQPWLAELQTKGNFFLDLGKAGLDLSGFDQNFLRAYCVVGGKTVGIPTGIGGQTILVNKTGALKAGVALDKITDWESLLAEGKRIHAKNKDVYLLSHDPTSSYMMTEAFLKQLTGNPVILDNYTLGFSKADIDRVFTWMANAVSFGLLQSPGEASLYAGKMEQNPKWSQQTLLMSYDWASNLSRYKSVLPKGNEFTVVPMPVIKGGKTGSTLMRPSQVFTVNANSANSAEAIKFLNWFMNDKEAALVLSDVRGVPATAKARVAVQSAKLIDELTVEALDYAAKNQALADSVLTHHSQIDEIFKDVTVKAEFGALTPSQASDELISRLNAKLKSLKATAK